jgi:hypothetical protein
MSVQTQRVIATSFVSEYDQFLPIYLYKISDHLYSGESNTMPAPLDSEVIDRVTQFWAREGHPLGTEKPSRRSLYEGYKQKVANELSWGAFSDIVKKLEFRAPPDPFPLGKWKPWVDPEESPADTAHLLRINAIMRVENGRDLYLHEANWGKRLRLALEGLPPFGQYRFVFHYSIREVEAYYLRKEQYTDDLDSFIAYRPWVSENQVGYNVALALGKAPYPVLDPFNNLNDPGPPPELQEELVQTFQFKWRMELQWMLTPGGSTSMPDWENSPEQARMQDWLLYFWGGWTDINQPAQDRQEAKEHDANQQEQLKTEQLVKP